MKYLFWMLAISSVGHSGGIAAADAPALLKLEEKSFAGIELSVARLNDPRLKLSLHWRNAEGQPYSRLVELRQQLTAAGRTFQMATNSGIYSQDFKPLGLHIENGKMLRPINKSKAPGGNFSMVPNGIFLVGANGPRVIETSEFASVKGKITFATQSGPLLVHNGQFHPAFQEGSENRKLRSGVGVTSKGVVVFAISRGAINFYDFANFFKTQLDCPNALYLDGTISAILTGNEPEDPQVVGFVGIWAVTSDPN